MHAESLSGSGRGKVLESHIPGSDDVRRRNTVIVGLLQRSSCGESAVAAVFNNDTEITRNKHSNRSASIPKAGATLKGLLESEDGLSLSLSLHR